MKKVLLLIVVNFLCISIYPQIIGRQYPAEWTQLVKDGRFIDRFLAMPDGIQTDVTWGTDSVQNRYIDNGIESAQISFWGGNMLQIPDGKYHLYVCGWPENSPKGHFFWPNSTVYHVVGCKSTGPLEVDIQSLRFGSYTEVNFGRGCKPLRTRKSGEDLIVVFSGKGSGIIVDEFAPKMLGRDKKGNMLYGYASLPYVNYQPALLSSRRPVYDKEMEKLKLEVPNFGLSASKPVEVEVLCNGVGQGRVNVKSLLPYEVVNLSLQSTAGSCEDQFGYDVVFFQDGVELERNVFR